MTRNVKLFLRIGLLSMMIVMTSDAATHFVVNPYIRFLEKSDVVISFEFDATAAGDLLYGTDQGNLDQAIRFDCAAFHEIKLSNLNPETVYYYDVRLNDADGIQNPDQQFFKTLPEKANPFVFAVYGDSSSGVESYDLNHGWVLRSVMEDTFPEFVVLTGDIVNDGSKLSDWRRFFELEHELTRNIPIYGVVGNNDSKGRPYFEKYFLYGDQKTQYSFDYNDCHFIVLDVLRGQGNAYYNSFRPGNPQFKWLLSDLQSENNTKAKFTFVFFHAPVFSPDGRGNIMIQEMLHPLFKKYGVDMVFNGTHCYSRGEKDGIIYFITGGGGAELREARSRKVAEIKEDANLFHHLRVHVDYPVIMTDVVDLRGSIFSSHTYWDPELDKSGAAEAQPETAGHTQVNTAVIAETNPSIPVSIFSLPSCEYCEKLIEKTIPRIAENMDVNIPIEYHSLNDAENFEKLIQLEQQLNDKDNELPVLIIGNKLLGGKREIKRELQKLIFLFTEDDQTQNTDADIDAGVIIKQKFNSFKLMPVILAGLLDGINPCAFTTIIFLLSYLIYLGKTKKQILWAGMSFSAGVFFTYMIIGLGFSEVLSSIRIHGSMAVIIKYVTFTLVLGLGVFNLSDAVKIKQGKLKDISLKLPGKLRKKIQDKVKTHSRKSGLIFGSFTLGFFVSTFELACTGQMYVPTLIYMLQISSARLKAVAYLLLYNLMFIIPLILVFLAVYFGLARDSVVRTFQKNLFSIKLLTALLFIGLAIFMLII